MVQKFWWVNHKQTHKQEIEGGYLWSPKREASGARSQYYENMRLANPGDVVLSYADGKIRFAGVVSDLAVSAPKPSEFGGVGSNWSAEGWLLPVVWKELPKTVTPKNMLARIAPFLPAKYSPIRASNAHGNQKAYLTEIGKQLFDEVARDGDFVATKTELSVGAGADFTNRQEDALQTHIQNDTSLSETEKEQLVRARKGQGQFRNNVSKVEVGCRVTGIINPTLLVASHIKPWRSCVTGNERLDGNNGLLLAPHVDHLFDRGLITFDENGNLLISVHLTEQELEQLGLRSGVVQAPKPFNANQQAYLEYHRQEIFLG
jgi:putative restriction endonuclease